MNILWLVLFGLNLGCAIYNASNDYYITAGLNFAAVILCGYRLIEALSLGGIQ